MTPSRAWKVESGRHPGAILLELGRTRTAVLQLQREALRGTPWSGLIDYALVLPDGQVLPYETRSYSHEDELGLETSTVDGRTLLTLHLVLRTGATLGRHESFDERVTGLAPAALLDPAVQAAIARCGPLLGTGVKPGDCPRCAPRKVRTSVPMPDDETTALLGLTFLSYGQYACATCGQRYARQEESEYLDPDQSTWHFDKLGLSPEQAKAQAGAVVLPPGGLPPPLPAPAGRGPGRGAVPEAPRPPPSPREAPVPTAPAPAAPARRKHHAVCCPKCGSTNAGRDGFFSDIGSDTMMCNSCHHVEMLDEDEEGGSWVVEVELADGERLPEKLPVAAAAPPAPDTGSCTRCTSDDAAVAWRASGAKVLWVVEEAPHDETRVLACACGAAFLERFTERVRYDGEGDDVTVQRWPLTTAELADLATSGRESRSSVLARLTAGRRSLVSHQPLRPEAARWLT